MNDDKKQLKLLRDQVARLISRNQELQERIVSLERERAEMALPDLVSALVESMQSAEAVLAAEMPDRRYTIPQFHAALRGFITRQGDTLAFRLPAADEAGRSDQMGSLQLTLGRIPATATDQNVKALRAALETAQSEFSGWNRRYGAAAANDVVERSTHLFAISGSWGEKEFVRAAEELAASLGRFAQALAGRVPEDRLQMFMAAVSGFEGVVKGAVSRGQATREEVGRIADTLNRTATRYRMIP
jgi:hypothetical protein